MNRKEIKKIINQHFRKLNKELVKVLKDFDAESLHQFRVNYKKLRAFTRLLALACTTEKIKISKKLNGLYHTGGSVRDLQLQEERVHTTNNQKPSGYKKYLHTLHNEKDGQKKRLKKMPSKKILDKNEMALIEHLPDALPAGAFELFFNLKWNAVLAMVKENAFDDEHLHSIRKNLKDIFYTLEIYRNELSVKSLPTIFAGKSEQYLKQLLSALGDHQDKHRAIELLSIQNKKAGVVRQKNLLQLKTVWSAEKLQMKELLVGQLKKDFGV